MKKLFVLVLCATFFIIFSILPVYAAKSTVIAVNCGGLEDIGEFKADQAKTDDNTWGYVVEEDSRTTLEGLEEGSDTLGIPADVYLTERFVSVDSLNYVFELPNKKYTVELYFAETWFGTYHADGGEGSRVFDIEVEGKAIKSDYDVFAEAGGASLATKVVHEVDLTDGELNISLLCDVSNPAIKAVRILAEDDEAKETEKPETQQPATSDAPVALSMIMAGASLIAALKIKGKK